MSDAQPLWLLVNSQSGSFSQTAVDEVSETFSNSGTPVARRIVFPDEHLPTPRQLADAGVAVLAVFTGDGTLNSALAQLHGWTGTVLVLPGGTMNLLSKRLHGPDAESGEIIRRWAEGAGRAVRPQVVRCALGDAYASLLVGPGTAWANVREAMRDFDIPALAQETTSAIAETAGGTLVACTDPDRGRPEGYPLIELTPSHRGMQVDGYHSEKPGEYVQQGFALLRRRFREGPHCRLGLLDELAIASADGAAIPVLVDGEAREIASPARFTVAESEIDLLATHHGY